MKVSKSIIFLCLILSAILFINAWILWSCKKQMLKDYSFITQKVINTNAKIYSKKEFEEDVETGNDRVSSTTTYTGYIYYYKFYANNSLFRGRDSSFEHIPYPYMEIEYLEENPKENRIKEFAKIQTGFDFFKEYFMIKIIFSAIIIVVFISSSNEEKRKRMKNIR